MKRVLSCLVSVSALVSAASVSASEPDDRVLRVVAQTVNPSEQVAYEAGIVQYNACLRDHGFAHGRSALSHETGDVYSYSYVTGPYAWAEFDAIEAAERPCEAILRRKVNPHLKSEISGFFRPLPELSWLPDGFDVTSKYVDVTFFKLKGDAGSQRAFLDVAASVATAAAKEKSPVAFSVQRALYFDRNIADFVVLSFAQSWKDFATIQRTPAMTLLEKADGKAAATAAQIALDGAVAEVWSHVDRHSAELSLPARK